MLVLRVPHSAKYLGAHAKVRRQELCLCNSCKQFFRVACASSCISPKPWQKEGVGRLHAKGDEWQLSEARSIFRQDEALGLSLPKQRAEGGGEGTRKPVIASLHAKLLREVRLGLASISFVPLIHLLRTRTGCRRKTPLEGVEPVLDGLSSLGLQLSETRVPAEVSSRLASAATLSSQALWHTRSGQGPNCRCSDQ